MGEHKTAAKVSNYRRMTAKERKMWAKSRVVHLPMTPAELAARERIATEMGGVVHGKNRAARRARGE